jgi:hypothetical protein
MKTKKPNKTPQEQPGASYSVMDPNMHFSTTGDERIKSLRLAMNTADDTPVLAFCMECAAVFDVAARVLSTLQPVDDDHLHSLAAISSLAHPVTQKWLKRCAADPDTNNIHASRGTKLNCGVIMLTARKLERPLLKDVQMTLSFDAKTIPFLKGNVFALDFPRKARKHHSLLSCKVQKHAIFNSLGEQYARSAWPEGQGLFFAGVAGWSKQDEFLADQALRLNYEHKIDEMEKEYSKITRWGDIKDDCSELTNYMSDLIRDTGFTLFSFSSYAFKQARQGNPGAMVLSVGSWGQLTWTFLNPKKATFTFMGMPELLSIIASPPLRERIKTWDLEEIFMFVVKVECGHGPPHSIIRTAAMDTRDALSYLDVLRAGFVDDDIGSLSEDEQDRMCIAAVSGLTISTGFNDLTKTASTAGRTCTYCAKVPICKKLKVCQGCKKTYYCDRTCQRNDWEHEGVPWHSRWCDMITAASADPFADEW